MRFARQQGGITLGRLPTACCLPKTIALKAICVLKFKDMAGQSAGTSHSIKNNTGNDMKSDDKIVDLTRDYRRVTQEIDRLEREKHQLRAKIQEYLEIRELSTLTIPVKKDQMVLELKQQVRIEYDKKLLKKRLGDQYQDILEIDAVRLRDLSRDYFRKEMLEPYLDEIGSPSRKKIAEMICYGELDKQDFKGAFKKTSRPVLYVKQVPLVKG